MRKFQNSSLQKRTKIPVSPAHGAGETNSNESSGEEKTPVLDKTHI